MAKKIIAVLIILFAFLAGMIWGPALVKQYPWIAFWGKSKTNTATAAKHTKCPINSSEGKCTANNINDETESSQFNTILSNNPVQYNKTKSTAIIRKADPYAGQTTTIISESSTPAEYTLGTIKAPIRGLEYELNRVDVLNSRQIIVHWKVHNLTNKTIRVNAKVRRILHPSKLAVVDFKYDRRFSVMYDDFVPRSNCMLTDHIPPGGRVNCSALVGPQFATNWGLRDNRVAVYLPGRSSSPIKVFVDIQPIKPLG